MSVNVIKQNDHETMVPELPRERLFSVKWKEAMRSTHHVLPGILPRCDEDIVPGQRQQQSQRNHIEFKVPNNDDKKLWRGRKHKTVSRRKVVTKKKKNSVCEECIHSRPIVTLMRQKLLRAHTDHMCDWKRHAFRDIHMQSQNQHGTKRKNKIRLQQRYRPGVGGSTPWPPEAFWACSWRGWRWGWVGAVRAPFLLANHLRGWGRVPCSAAARQSWPFHTQPQNPSIWPHTPHTPSSLTLSLQVPIPSLLP